MPARYNTARQKILDGVPLVGGTIFSPDPDIYCTMATAGFDFLWIEMQHSPLTYADAARMIWAGRGLPAIPFIRVPDGAESTIQKATDIGALGIIVPTIETAEQASAAAKWSRYPPLGRRSQGPNQAERIWGPGYRDTFNDNVVVVVMIETPEGVAQAGAIAATPGVDVVFAASNDMTNFSGFRQGEPDYDALIGNVRDETIAAGKTLGGPHAWQGRPGFSFFQGPGESALVTAAAKTLLGR